MRRICALALAIVSALGCGEDPFFSTDPVRAPPPTDSGGDGAGCEKPCSLASKTPGYPPCGCGTRTGDLIDDYEFVGKDASKGGTAAKKVTIRLGDFHDPDRTKGLRFMILSVSAIWCVACKAEAAQLPGLHAKYGPRGVVFVTNLMQNASRGPSSDADVDLWISTYKLDTWVVRDDLQVLAGFFDPAQMPLNMIVDLQTMRITKLFIGASLDKIESELDAKL